MRFSIIVAATAAASVNAAALKARQGGYDLGKCNLDAFVGHTSEALLFCSSILKSGTVTSTTTVGATVTLTSTKKVTTTVYPPSKTPTPKPTPTPTPKPTPTPTPTPTPAKPSTPVPPKSSTPVAPPPSSTVVTVPSPSPTSGAGCGIVAYVKSTPAYYFESSGTKNTFSACQALCKADSKCVSFGYGEANCMLFDVKAEDNTNYNPMSPYTFYDITCPKELPVRKRQIGITLGDNPGINISLGLGSPREISSACSCLITRGPGETTVTKTATSNATKTATTTSTVTRTAGGDDDLTGDN